MKLLSDLLPMFALWAVAWWAQRDAYRSGVIAGKLEAQQARLMEGEQPPPLRLIRGGRR